VMIWLMNRIYDETAKHRPRIRIGLREELL
jgi:hypothetical protein